MAIQHLNFAQTGITSLPAGAFEGLFFRSTVPHSDPIIDLSDNPLQVRNSPGTPRSRSNFFHFHAVFGKNLAFSPNSRVGVPRLGNPGSATVLYFYLILFSLVLIYRMKNI